MGEGIEVIGADDVQRALDSLTDAVLDLERAHEEAGELLLERADPPSRSGRLGASGRVEAGSDETALVYDEIYAGPIHNGWPAHNIEAQPWAAEAAADNSDDVLGVFADYLQDAISTA